MSNDYTTDRAWANTFESQVLTILKRLLPYVVVLTVASDEADMQRATDFEIELLGGTVAVRLRRKEECAYRDWTIRSRREDGTKTELAKIKEGHASRYFYGWVDEQNIINEWMLIDLDDVRSKAMLEKPRREIANRNKNGKPDGTFFIAINYRELLNVGCIIAFRIHSDRPILVKKRVTSIYASRFTVPPIPLSLWSEQAI